MLRRLELRQVQLLVFDNLFPSLGGGPSQAYSGLAKLKLRKLDHKNVQLRPLRLSLSLDGTQDRFDHLGHLGSVEVFEIVSGIDYPHRY